MLNSLENMDVLEAASFGGPPSKEEKGRLEKKEEGVDRSLPWPEVECHVYQQPHDGTKHEPSKC